MKKTVITINEATIRKMVEECVSKVINELSNDENSLLMEFSNSVSFRIFLGDLKSLGLSCIFKNGKYSIFLKSCPQAGKVTVHPPHGGKAAVKADTLRHVCNLLDKAGLLNNPEFVKKIPSYWEANL